MPVAMNKGVAALNGTIPVTINPSVAALKENIPIAVNTTLAALKGSIPGTVSTTVAVLKGHIPASVNTTLAALNGNMPVVLNTTVAVLHNRTRTEATEQQGFQPNPHLIGPVWTSCPSCYSESFEYTYVYSLLLLLFVAALACIKFGIQRRNELIRRAEAQSRAARLRALVNGRGNTDPPNNNIGNANNNNHNSPKEDLPPAYDDINPPRFSVSVISPAVTNHLPVGSSTFSTGISNEIELHNMASVATTRSAVIEILSRPDARIDITNNVN